MLFYVSLVSKEENASDPEANFPEHTAPIRNPVFINKSYLTEGAPLHQTLNIILTVGPQLYDDPKMKRTIINTVLTMYQSTAKKPNISTLTPSVVSQDEKKGGRGRKEENHSTSTGRHTPVTFTFVYLRHAAHVDLSATLTQMAAPREYNVTAKALPSYQITTRLK